MEGDYNPFMRAKNIQLSIYQDSKISLVLQFSGYYAIIPVNNIHIINIYINYQKIFKYNVKSKTKTIFIQFLQ